MLYLIYRANHPNLPFKGGQGPIIHLEADLRSAVDWAEATDRKWAFTLSNAGARYFEDRSDLRQLNEINWEAVSARWWQGANEEAKQAEFLVQQSFPWHLVERIGVFSQGYVQPVSQAMQGAAHRPGIEIRNDWYY